MNDKIKMIGIWEFKVIDKKTGKVLEEEIVKNTIVNNGKQRIAELLNGVSAVNFNTIGIGIGVTGALVTDTDLETEDQREVATLAYEADYKATYEKIFSFASSGTTAITEAGIFDSDVASGSTMLNRATFSAKNCDTETSLNIKVTLSIA